MQHNFTDEQIDAAKHLAARHMSRDWISRFNVKDIRAFLNALPEPTSDDWQDVTDIRQIRRGDMLKNETENAIITYKCAVKRVDLSNGIIHLDNDELVFWHDNHTYYRIPAPVQHPDPAQHPVIIVHLHNGVKETKRAFVWNGESYGCLDGPHSFLTPYQITEWSPAKVVEDDR